MKRGEAKTRNTKMGISCRRFVLSARGEEKGGGEGRGETVANEGKGERREGGRRGERGEERNGRGR